MNRNDYRFRQIILILIILGIVSLIFCGFNRIELPKKDTTPRKVIEDIEPIVIVEEVKTTTPPQKDIEVVPVIEEPEWKKRLPCSEEFKAHVAEVADYYKFDEYLIYQIMYVESTFNPKADNGLCRGLMQCHRKYEKHYASWDDDYSTYFKDGCNVFDPYTNVILGCRFLSDWRRMTGSSTYDTLCYYNRGWTYKNDHVTWYADKVLGTDLETVSFEGVEVIQ